MKRLKAEEPGTPWELSYGDLMSLLMAVFVMITAMSELRNGQRFGSISQSMRAALGFDGALASMDVAAEASLLEQLRKAGWRSDGLASRGTDAEVLAPCEVITEGQQTLIRIAGSAAFEPASERLKPAGRQALLRIAQFLTVGGNPIEIRAYGSAVQPGTEMRDSLDLSYERARAVLELMKQSGVKGERLRLSAGEQTKISKSGPADRDRCIEIVLHSISTAYTDAQIAEKEQL